MNSNRSARTPVYSGVVQHGDKRGRTLGYPTINLDPGPASARDVETDDGVWAGIVTIGPDGRSTSHVAAISVGRRTTYYAKTGIRLVEAYLLDFHGEVYGEQVRIECRTFLRSQAAFEDSGALTAQLESDVAAVRAWNARATGERRGQKGWGPTRRGRKRDRAAIFMARERRREALIAEAVRTHEGQRLSHELISKATRLPVGYLQHRYPTLADLASATPDSNRE